MLHAAVLWNMNGTPSNDPDIKAAEDADESPLQSDNQHIS
jgi:hypothetical protein